MIEGKTKDISGNLSHKVSQLGDISHRKSNFQATSSLNYGEYEDKVPLPNDFVLNDDMRNYATLKGIQANDVDYEFEQFCNNKKQHRVLSYDWVALWQSWCNNHNRRKTHLPRIPMDEGYILDNTHFIKAKEIINFASSMNESDIKLKINVIFNKFKSWHISKGTLNANWFHAWVSWCERANEYEKQNQKTTKAKERAEFMWDFQKAEIVSDKIKKYLKDEHNIIWQEFIRTHEQFEFKNIGWSSFKHPTMPKNITLLFIKDDQTNTKAIELQSQNEAKIGN